MATALPACRLLAFESWDTALLKPRLEQLTLRSPMSPAVAFHRFCDGGLLGLIHAFGVVSEFGTQRCRLACACATLLDD